jgi:hypothetical protein
VRDHRVRGDEFVDRRLRTVLGEMGDGDHGSDHPAPGVEPVTVEPARGRRPPAADLDAFVPGAGHHVVDGVEAGIADTCLFDVQPGSFAADPPTAKVPGLRTSSYTDAAWRDVRGSKGGEERWGVRQLVRGPDRVAGGR